MTEREFYNNLRIGRVRDLTGEIVLSYKEVQNAIHTISEKACFTILGGDVLDTNDEYIYANWYYQPDGKRSPVENARASCQKALAYIASLANKESYNYILVLQPV